MLTSPILMRYHPACWMMNVGDFCYPLVGSEVRRMRVVYVDRENHTVLVVDYPPTP